MQHVSGPNRYQSATEQQEKDVAASVADTAFAEESSSGVAGSRKRKDTSTGDSVGERTQDTENAHASAAKKQLHTQGMQAVPADGILIMDGGAEEASVVLSGSRAAQSKTMEQRSVALQSKLQELELEGEEELAAYVSTIESDLGGIFTRRARAFLVAFEEDPAEAFTAAEEEYKDQQTNFAIMLQLAIRLGEESHKIRLPAKNADLAGIGSLRILHEDAKTVEISAPKLAGLKKRYATWKFTHRTAVYAGLNAAPAARAHGLWVLGEAGKNYTGSTEDREQLQASITAFQITYAQIVASHTQSSGTKTPPYQPGSLFLSEYAKEGGTATTSIRDILHIVEQKFSKTGTEHALQTMQTAIGHDIAAAKSSTDLTLLQALLQNFKILCAVMHLSSTVNMQVENFLSIYPNKEVSPREMMLGIAELALTNFPTTYNVKNLLHACGAPVPTVRDAEELEKVEPVQCLQMTQETAAEIGAATLMLVVCRQTTQELPTECFHQADKGRMALVGLFETVGTECTDIEERNTTLMERARAHIDFPPSATGPA